MVTGFKKQRERTSQPCAVSGCRERAPRGFVTCSEHHSQEGPIRTRYIAYVERNEDLAVRALAHMKIQEKERDNHPLTQQMVKEQREKRAAAAIEAEKERKQLQGKP